MKKIILGALDYGLAFGVDRTLRQLLVEGRLSAVGCLVGGDLWAREFMPLKEFLSTPMGRKARVGLTVALSGDHVQPVSARMRKVYGERLPSHLRLDRLGMMRLLPDQILQEEITAQIEAFTTRMERAPDFIAVREGLLARSEIQRNLLEVLAGQAFDTKPDLLAPSVSGRAQERFRRRAGKAGYRVLSWGEPVPETDRHDLLIERLRHHFDALSEDTFVATLAGEADDRLRRLEPPAKLALRECQRSVLTSDRFFRLLDERGVFLF